MVVGCGWLRRRGWPEGQRPGATPSGAREMMVYPGGARCRGTRAAGVPLITGQLGSRDGLQQCGCEGYVVAAVDARGQSMVMVVAVDAVLMRCVTQAPPPYDGAMGGD